MGTEIDFNTFHGYDGTCPKLLRELKKGPLQVIRNDKKLYLVTRKGCWGMLPFPFCPYCGKVLYTEIPNRTYIGREW